jgi:hypothetical protein
MALKVWVEMGCEKEGKEEGRGIREKKSAIKWARGAPLCAQREISYCFDPTVIDPPHTESSRIYPHLVQFV